MIKRVILSLLAILCLFSAALDGLADMVFEVVIPPGGLFWDNPPRDQWGVILELLIRNRPAGDLSLSLENGNLPAGRLYWSQDAAGPFEALQYTATPPVHIPSTGNKEVVRVYLRPCMLSSDSPGDYLASLAIRYTKGGYAETKIVPITIRLASVLSLLVTPNPLVLQPVDPGGMPVGQATATVTAGTAEAWQLAIHGSNFRYSGTSIEAFNIQDLQYSSAATWAPVAASAPYSPVAVGTGPRSAILVNFRIINPLDKSAGDYQSTLWWILVSP